MLDQEKAEYLAALAVDIDDSITYLERKRDKLPRPTLRTGMTYEYRNASDSLALARARRRGVDMAADAIGLWAEYKKAQHKLKVKED